MDDVVEKKHPRILVVSSNAFSKTSNNGKTLASFFKEFPSNRIAQLYFNQEIPTDLNYSNYFRITDKEIVKSLFTNEKPGSIIDVSKTVLSNSETITSKSNIQTIIRKYNIFRIAREIVWLSKKWNTDVLNQWLTNFNPNVVFLCAGDGGFTYKITEYIVKKFNAKLIVYITDDYILPRRTVSPFWWLRRNYVYSNMKKTVKQSDLFITISEEMKSTYKKLFGMDSVLAMNMPESILDANEYANTDTHGRYRLVYAGGLHFKRYKTLNLLAEAIIRYNKSSSVKKAFLEIYSSEPSKKVLKQIEIEGASKFCGYINQEQLNRILNECDIPVHVESFDRRSIESTRLSISTKIPEYLSLGKPILAIGPKEVASMRFLDETAFCITNPNIIYIEFNKLLSDEEQKSFLSTKALEKFKENYDLKLTLRDFMKNIQQ